MFATIDVTPMLSIWLGELIALHLFINSNINLTWLYWVFHAEHGWPVSTPHAYQHFLLGQVSPSILHPDAVLHVVEIAAIQPKELDQQDAQVDVGTSCVDSRV